jgi:serine/threonine protein kinase
MCEVRPDDDPDGQGVLALSKDESPGTIAPQKFGAYRVLHQAGSGILGPVFRALDPQHDRLAAIKVFHLDTTPEDAARVAVALRALASLPPGVSQPRLFDAGAEGARPFLAMAFQDGETFDVLLRRVAPRPLEELLPLLLAVSQAVDRAAELGVHHGALHPRDIIQDEVAPRVWITGFGVRQALQASGVALPAPRRGYSAPEVVTRLWDGRADVFSMGAIVHEWLTRKRPAIGGDQDGTLAGELSPEQRVEIRRVLRRALATDPAARFASAGDFVKALLASVDSPLIADEVGGAHPQEPTIRRDPPAEIAAAVVAEPSPISNPAPRPLSVDSPVNSRDLALGSAVAFGVPLDRAGSAIPAVTPYRARRRWAAFPWVAAAVGGIAVGIAAGALAAGWRDRERQAPDLNVVLSGPNTETEVAVDPLAGPVAAGVVGDEAGAAVVRKGQLTVRSQPAGAMVTVDGQILGATPLVATDIALGTHDVVVARPGHVPRSERVVLLAGAPRRTLNVALESGVEIPPALGTVDVVSSPRGARVLVDGRFVGRTPLRAPELAPGVRRVTLELDGYVTMTTPVAVSRGGIHAVRVTMEAGE